MKRYNVSIETNEHSIHINYFSNLKKAKKDAHYTRTVRLTHRNEFKAIENPNVCIYDTKKQDAIYTMPLYKYALKK